MNRTQYKQWLIQRLAEVEPTIARPATEHEAQIVFEAKSHAYALGLYELANQLPERETKTPLDCCLRLRECLAYLERPPSAARDGDSLIGLEEAAQILGYKPSGLRKIVAKRRIQFVQHGRGPIKFRREWLDEFINANGGGPQDIQRSPAQSRISPIAMEPRFGFDPSLFHADS